MFLDGRPAGAAVPFVIGRHVTAPSPPAPPAADPTGIDYLGIVAAAPMRKRTGAAINFARLSCSAQQGRQQSLPGAVGGAFRAGPHPVRQVNRRRGPVRPAGPRPGDRPDQLLHRRNLLGVIAGASRRQDRRRPRRGRRLTPPAPGLYVADPAFGTRAPYLQVVPALGAQPRYLEDD